MPFQACCAGNVCDGKPATVVMYFHMQRGSDPLRSPFTFCVEGYTNSALTHHTSGLAAATPRPPSAMALPMKPRRCSSCVCGIQWVVFMARPLKSRIKCPDSHAQQHVCTLVTIHLPTFTVVSVFSYLKPGPSHQRLSDTLLLLSSAAQSGFITNDF